ncbi:MAG: proline--tRNA ligase [Deltaproteobacteria bacterium]|nr:proline--tRNA ligase [Deltaproteobacteria bacterium]
MRWSQSFLPTLRDDPAGAEAASHILMVRAGLIRQLGAGLYSYLPLATRVMARIEAIVREEMTAIGGQELRLPALHPAEIWKESGRWDQVDATLFRLQDRRGADMALAMTAEEVFTSIARDDLASYRLLPQIWYQIQPKFRDEPRPKSGVLRGRQFLMKDSYSFDLDEAGLAESFQKHHDAYRRVYERCGLEPIPVEASSGTMGGSESVEFMAVCDAGEDWIVTCDGCGYAANLEKATSRHGGCGEADDPDSCPAPEKFATPDQRTIEELAQAFDFAPATRQIKTLVQVVDGQPVLFLLRGDYELNDVKQADALGTTDQRPARPEEIEKVLGAQAGSLGAVGVEEIEVYADESLRGRRGMVTGANEDGFHLRHVDVERDLPQVKWVDVRSVVEGEGCSNCGEPIALKKTIEIGHIFKLGVRYSEPMRARVLTAEGKETPLVMGSYGIGIDRIMAAAIEAHHDDDGIVWPKSIAPFDVVVSPVKMKDEVQRDAAEKLYAELREAGFEVLLDDRDERPGVKFKDADLIGVPFRIVPGPRALVNGNVEFVTRGDRSGEKEEVPLGDVVEELRRRLA